jgi:ABC-type bacteriocin/lantibiotic exporter with double-glycine peptidase domain
MSKFFLFENIRNYFNLLPRNFYSRFIFLLFLILINSFLEFISVASIIPLVSSLTQSDILLNFLAKLDIQKINSENLVILSIIFFVLMFFIKFLFSIVLNFFRLNFISLLRKEFSNKFINIYLSLNYQQIIEKHSSSIIRNLETEIEIFCSHLTDAFIQILNHLFIILSIVLLLYLFNPKSLIIISIFSLCFCYGYISFYKKRVKIYGDTRQESERNRLKLIQNIFRMIKEIKIYSANNFFKYEYMNELSNFIRIDKKYNFIQSNTKPILEFFVIIICLIVLFFNLAKGLNLNDLIIEIAILAGGAFRILPSINTLIYQAFSIKFYIPCINVLQKDMDKYQKVESDNEVLKFNQTLRLENISFKYENSKHETLKDINIIIKRGDIIGISGQTGSGKTTLAEVICGLLKASKGFFYLDGKKIDNKKNFLIDVAYVSQNIILIDDTIKKNIAFGLKDYEIDETRILKSLQDADIYNLVQILPQKENSKLHEMGYNFSGGQRQRLSIARAYYKDASIIIFDEPTSALDDYSSKIFIDKIKKNKKTAIIISHNNEVLRSCTKIYYMKDGTLSEENSFFK